MVIGQVSSNTSILKKTLSYALFIGMVFFGTSSCTSVKNQVYFENLKKDTTLRKVVSGNYDIKIQKNDLLGISVASLSPDVAFYNASVASASAGAGVVGGYKVDKNGNINFVKIGWVRAEGKTRKELKDTLEAALVPYLKEVIVNISFLDRHITMLGAVNTRVLPLTDNMTVLDALASSGDISDKGRIDNLLIIRDSNDEKHFERLNMKNNSIFYSPYFYLQPNDIVYVEPRTVKPPVTGIQIASYITTALTLVFLLINNVFKL